MQRRQPCLGTMVLTPNHSFYGPCNDSHVSEMQRGEREREESHQKAEHKSYDEGRKL